MIIKKFQGKTEEEAVETAKEELGNDVVIMNVKNIKKRIFAFFQRKMVEVTVALEDEKEIQAKEDNKVSLTPRGVNPESIEKKLDSLQVLLERQIQNRPDEEKFSKTLDEVLQEDGNLEKEDGKSEENEEQEKFIRLLYNKLIENEVDEKYVNQLFEDIEKNRKPNIPMDYLLASIYQKMILKFGKSEGVTSSEKGAKIVMFIGPTGVGKTTTIAKIAGGLVVNEKKKVAMLTADTYRIAATEQLRTYANILETPFRIIYTVEELKVAIEDYKEYDYIFVDTAGHSHQNEEQLAKIKEMLEAAGNSENRDTFLVLSATTKYSDLLKIAKSYQNITEYQLIFTKLDETIMLGNLLNLKLYTDTPIAYVTYGQNVPEDIERFNPQKTVKQLLGGKN